MSERDAGVTLGLLSVGITVVLLGGVVTAGFTDGGSETGESQAEGDAIAVTIDCNASEVRVTAPAEAEYSLRVGQATVGPTSSETESHTTDASGNTTVSVGSSGVIFAFVMQDAETVTSAVENCDDDSGEQTTDRPTDEAQPSITVDCNARQLQVNARADQKYTLRVSQLQITPTGTDLSANQRTASGNTTASLAEERMVFAFVTTDAGTVATASENCTQYNETSP